MGCSGSKAEDLPLVVRCRERRELIRAAANHRYALAASHVAYFRSLKDVGDALRKFVDEELIITSASSSSLSSPSLILPPVSAAERKNGGKSLHLHKDGDVEEEESHLHISDSSSDNDGDSDHDSEDGRQQHHSHRVNVHNGKGFDDGVKNSHNVEESTSNYSDGGSYGYGYGMMNQPSMYSSYLPRRRSHGEPYMDHQYYSNNSNVYYMKKSAPAMKTVVQEPPAQPDYGYSDSYWNSAFDYGGGHGYFSVASAMRTAYNEGLKVSPQQGTPPPPSPKLSAWDFFNPFDVFDGGYEGYYSTGNYGYESNSSSPDSSEVREREGIPDLEEETESEVYKEVFKGKTMKAEAKKSSGGSTPGSRAVPVPKSIESSSRSMLLRRSEGRSRSVPLHKIESRSRSVPSGEESERPSVPLHGESVKPSMPPQYSDECVKPSMSLPHCKGKLWIEQSPNGDMAHSINLTDDTSSPETPESKTMDEVSVKKKGADSGVDRTSKGNVGSSKCSVTMLSPDGTRDLRGVVAEIRDHFEIASGYGKEVAMMLEVGKMPYQPSFLRVILSRILYLIAPSVTFRDSLSMQSVKLASRSVKLAKSYFEDVGKDINVKVGSLSSTLDKLYVWEKKLYKEVKDEERHRIIYEKQCKRLKILGDVGAESGKIYAAQASARRLLTKLDVCIKAIDVISSRIHKLRDEELQPKVAALIHGLIRMWKAMLNCHQRQFQAITESKMQKLKMNTDPQTDSSLRATTKLEKELRAWHHHFNDWIGFQKSYVESLNGWLLQCLQYEPEETPDGPVPYSPGQLGAPPIFIICNDWHQAMEAISEGRVANAMSAFATSLQKLWEKQDEEERQRLKAEYLSKNYEKLLRTHHLGRGKTEQEQDALSDKAGLSIVPSDTGVLPQDDVKLNLDSLRQRLAEERIKHKDAMKLVRNAASNSLQGGLVPIFKVLENFTSEALEAHEHVRL